MNAAQLDKFRSFIATRTGIALETDRDDRLDLRLTPVMRAHKISGLSVLLDRTIGGGEPLLTQAVIEALVTAETFFFRDRQMFDIFRDEILPALISARQHVKRLRIWCAAASSGQEPYSIAMILDEKARDLRGWRIEIIATDISTAVLEAARAGYYNQFEVQRGLPVALLLRYFHRENERWRIAEHLRSKIEFRQFNLMDDFNQLCGFDRLCGFDIIFCRNVLMYFGAAAKSDILQRLAQCTAQDGRIFLGATETAPSTLKSLAADPCAAACYQPRVRRSPADAASMLASQLA